MVCEISGICGAVTSMGLILYFGSNYSLFITPVLFALAGVAWLLICLELTVETSEINKSSYLKASSTCGLC